MATMIPCMSTSTTDVKGESIASVLLGQVDIFLRYLQFVLMSRYEASLQNAFFEEFDVGQAMRVALCVQNLALEVESIGGLFLKNFVAKVTELASSLMHHLPISGTVHLSFLKDARKNMAEAIVLNPSVSESQRQEVFRHTQNNDESSKCSNIQQDFNARVMEYLVHLRKVEEVRSSCMSCLPQSKLASNMDMDFPVDHLCLCKWMSSLCGWFGAAGGFVWFDFHLYNEFLMVTNYPNGWNLFISMFSIGESDIAMAEVEEFPRVQHAIFSWLASNFQQYGKNMIWQIEPALLVSAVEFSSDLRDWYFGVLSLLVTQLNITATASMDSVDRNVVSDCRETYLELLRRFLCLFSSAKGIKVRAVHLMQSNITPFSLFDVWRNLALDLVKSTTR